LVTSHCKSPQGIPSCPDTGVQAAS
jgi:hypothetical protein